MQLHAADATGLVARRSEHGQAANLRESCACASFQNVHIAIRALDAAQNVSLNRFLKISRDFETTMTTVGYARVSSAGQDLAVQLEKLKNPHKVFKEKRSGVDAGRPELKRCLEYLREGDTLLVTKLDRLARSTSDLYRIVSQLAEKGVEFKVIDDPSIDTSSRTGKLVMGILALISSSRTTSGVSVRWMGSKRRASGELGLVANSCSSMR